MLEAHIAPVDEKREHGYLISSLDILYLGGLGDFLLVSCKPAETSSSFIMLES